MEPVTAAKATDAVPRHTKVRQKGAEVRGDQREAANRDVVNSASTGTDMNLFVKYYAPQSNGGNSHKNQKEEGQAGKSGSRQRSTKKTTKKSDSDKQTKANANSVD
ncbi:hypothetical protein BH09BAC4_BH09BAC4_49350 [soil metagenome]